MPMRWERLGVAGSMIAYNIPRVSVLRGYNMITRDLIDEVEARREPGRQVLVSGDGMS